MVTRATQSLGIVLSYESLCLGLSIKAAALYSSAGRPKRPTAATCLSSSKTSVAIILRCHAYNGIKLNIRERRSWAHSTARDCEATFIYNYFQSCSCFRIAADNGF